MNQSGKTSSAVSAAPKKGAALRRQQRQALYGCFYILPAVLIITAFCIVTIFMTVYYSFTEYNILKPPQFIAFKNYARLLTDKAFKASLVNTVKYVIVTVPAQVCISLGLAAFLAEKLQNKFGSFAKSVMFIPYIVSGVAASSVWSMAFKPNGVINTVLKTFGHKGLNWLGDKNLAFLCVCIVAIWKSIGYFLVIYYAGVQGVPREQHEAARCDGATALQRFWYITVPAVKPITYMVVTLSIISSFQIFDVIYRLTSGGPGTATMTLAYVIYQVAFKDWNMGYACALALILLIFVLAINLIQDIFFKERPARGEKA